MKFFTLFLLVAFTLAGCVAHQGAAPSRPPTPTPLGLVSQARHQPAPTSAPTLLAAGATLVVNPGQRIQQVAANARPGDTIQVNAGDYEGFAFYGLKGTQSQPITFRANGQVNIVTKATAETQLNVGIELSGTDASSGCAYIVVEGFNVNNQSGTISGGMSAGVRCRFSNHITLRNTTAQNCGWVGFYLSYLTDSVVESCQSIKNNGYVDASTQRNHGMYVAQASRNITVKNCLIDGNNGNGLHSNGDGNVITGNLYQGNTICNNGANGGSAINCDGLASSTITENILYDNKNKGISLYAIDASGPSKNNTISNNYVIAAANANGPCMQVKDGATGSKILNNTLVHMRSSGLLIDFFNDSLSGTSVQNKTYYAANAKPLSGDGSAQSVNDWQHVNYSGWDANVFYLNMSVSAQNTKAHCDVNLDGQITGDDYTLLDANLNKTFPAGSGWAWINGDVNQDGKVTGADYTVLDSQRQPIYLP